MRGSLPATGQEFVRYGGHTSCLAISKDGDQAPTLLLDAGTGLTAASALFDGAPFRGTIALSHLHWDHTHGLPFFAAGDREDARVRVLVPEQEDGRSAEEALTGLMSPPYFPITPGELRGQWTIETVAEREHEVEGFGILALTVPHKGGRTVGYRITSGERTLTYIPDHSPTALGPGPDGFGEYHEAALELTRGADLLVHDSQLFKDELAAEGEFGHALGDYAVGLATRAGARRVALFHHKFTRTDDQLDALAQRLGAAPGDGAPEVIVAREGETIEL
ncbi:MAG TPA: MBL fold metallo-hydrolase [Solirubrobacteraceae bacterium]|nr:MBL fold metallo-hydrolase [Solirubrobacteraceae bacterium]